MNLYGKIRWEITVDVFYVSKEYILLFELHCIAEVFEVSRKIHLDIYVFLVEVYVILTVFKDFLIPVFIK